MDLTRGSLPLPLCTFPGKHGDVLWSLLTAREIARRQGTRVHFVVSQEVMGLVPLIDAQPYVAACWSDGWSWKGDPGAGEQIVPQFDYQGLYGVKHVHHLHYKGWPKKSLPLEIWEQARMEPEEEKGRGFAEAAQDPWITLPENTPRGRGACVFFGWSEEWFELKVGLSLLVRESFEGTQCYMPHGRWASEAAGLFGAPANWLETASMLAACDLFVGCLSSQWVLANAMGVPCVVVEPNVARHNPIFWWEGRVLADGAPANTMVLGNDGKPTFDARAVKAAVKAGLERVIRLRELEIKVHEERRSR